MYGSSFSDFERIIQMSFRDINFNVIPNTKENQIGYDFIATKEQRMLAVQVKNYKNNITINVVIKWLPT